LEENVGAWREGGNEGTLPEMPNDHFGKSQFWQMPILANADFRNKVQLT
jgi:hypothetical protein